MLSAYCSHTADRVLSRFWDHVQEVSRSRIAPRLIQQAVEIKTGFGDALFPRKTKKELAASSCSQSSVALDIVNEGENAMLPT